MGGNTLVFTSGGMATRYPGNTPTVTCVVTSFSNDPLLFSGPKVSGGDSGSWT